MTALFTNFLFGSTGSLGDSIVPAILSKRSAAQSALSVKRSTERNTHHGGYFLYLSYLCRVGFFSSWTEYRSTFNYGVSRIVASEICVRPVGVWGKKLDMVIKCMG